MRRIEIDVRHLFRANNHARQADAENALDAFYNGGRIAIESQVSDYWMNGWLQLKEPSTNSNFLEQGWDSPNLTQLGHVRGLATGDAGEVALSIEPIFNPQSIVTILDNIGNLENIFDKPGLFLEEVGVGFSVDGLTNTELTAEFVAQWDPQEPKWRDANPSLSVGVTLLDFAGGTLNFGGNAVYDVGDRKFYYAASVQYQIQLP